MTKKTPKPYSEDNPDHVPNPMWQSGVVDTTGTFGDAGQRIENISPVFAQARAAALGEAVEDLADGNEDRVVLPEEELTREDAEKNLKDAAKEAEKEPQLQNPAATPAAQEAAETGDPAHPSEASAANKGEGPDRAHHAPAKKSAPAKASDKK